MRRLILALCLPLSAAVPVTNEPFLNSRETYVAHKTAHALIGMGVVWAGHELGYPKTGIACAFGLGVAKELYDKKHGGRFRAGDVAWTVMPAATISIAVRW